MSKYETDVSLVNSSADMYLEQWETGKDIAVGIGLGTTVPFSELLRHVSKNYTEFDRDAFDDFAQEVIKQTTGGVSEQYVRYMQVGYTKAGFLLIAEVYALEPVGKRISGTRT